MTAAEFDADTGFSTVGTACTWFAGVNSEPTRPYLALRRQRSLGYQKMLARSSTFRCLLALLIALWSPMCLCSSGADEPGPNHASEQTKTHGCCPESNQDGDHHGRCPGHDHKGSGCTCPQLTATLVKADQLAKACGELTVIVVYPVGCDMPAPHDPLADCVRLSTAVPRPSTSLLRMHCALIV